MLLSTVNDDVRQGQNQDLLSEHSGTMITESKQTSARSRYVILHPGLRRILRGVKLERPPARVHYEMTATDTALNWKFYVFG